MRVHLQIYFFQLQLEKLGVTSLSPKTGFSEENLKAYLKTPPTGISCTFFHYVIDNSLDGIHLVILNLEGIDLVILRVSI